MVLALESDGIINGLQGTQEGLTPLAKMNEEIKLLVDLIIAGYNEKTEAELQALWANFVKQISSPEIITEDPKIIRLNEIFSNELISLQKYKEVNTTFGNLYNSLVNFSNILQYYIIRDKLIAIEQKNDSIYKKNIVNGEIFFLEIVNIIKKIGQIQQGKEANQIFDDFLTQLGGLLEQFNNEENILEELDLNIKKLLKERREFNFFTHIKPVDFSGARDIQEKYIRPFKVKKHLTLETQIAGINGTIELELLKIEQQLKNDFLNSKDLLTLKQLEKIFHTPSLSQRLRGILEELKEKDHSIREKKFLKIMELLQGKGKNFLFVESMLEGNKKTFLEIKKFGILETGGGSFFIPGGVNALRKLIEYGILFPKNIDIQLGKGDNIQEGLQLRKGKGDCMNLFERSDTIEKFKLQMGNGSSLAHMVTFFANENEENNYTLDINIGNNSFVGISAMIGNRLKMGDNSTIWFGTYIGENVSIGSNVLIGTGCSIDDGMDLKNNYLVPNFAHITKNSPIISYDEFIKNPDIYHTSGYTNNGRRSFIIDLGKGLSEEQRNNELEKVEQALSQSHNEKLSSINTSYAGMTGFNKNAVVPENKLFSVLKTIFAYLEREIPHFKAKEEPPLQSSLEEEKLQEIIGNGQNNLGEINLVKITYLKNKEDFIFSVLQKVLEFIENKEFSKARSLLENSLSRPTIEFSPNDKQEKLLGKVVLTGNVIIKEKIGVIYNSYLRGDELHPGESIVIGENATLKNCVAHGGGNKIVENSLVDYTVIHGATTIEDSQIGNPHHPSTLHNVIVKNLQAPDGDIVCVGASIKNASFAKGVKISGGGQEGEVFIKNSNLGEGVSVNPGAQIMNTNILIPNFYIGKGVVLNTLGDITENNLGEIQKKLGGSYQVNENSIILKEKKENKVTPITQTSGEEDKDKNKKENLKNPFDIPTNMQIINNGVNQLLQRIGENLQERAKQTGEIINTTLESIYNLLGKK